VLNQNDAPTHPLGTSRAGFRLSRLAIHPEEAGGNGGPE
jgi:hypothetical protein